MTLARGDVFLGTSMRKLTPPTDTVVPESGAALGAPALGEKEGANRLVGDRCFAKLLVTDAAMRERLRSAESKSGMEQKSTPT